MDIITADQVPSFETSNAESKSLLTVILTDLDQAGLDQLTSHLQGNLDSSTTIQGWIPSKQLLRSIARQGSYKDSQANIYALAALLMRLGWAGFVVADGLTSRQITGNCRLGEKPTISVVMVAVKAKDGQLRVVCRRTSDESGDSSTLLETLRTLEPARVERDSSYKEEDVYAKHGAIIHDPDRSIFTSDAVDSTTREELTKAVATSLSKVPAELIADIMVRADGDGKYPIKIPFGERSQDTNHLIVFLFFPTSESELAQTQTAISDAVQNEQMTVELIPWERHRISSRRELLAFLSEYTIYRAGEAKKRAPLNLLLERFQELELGHFGTIDSDEKMPARAVRTTLSNIISKAKGKEDAHDLAQPHSHIENLFYPDEPFYFNPPLWLPAEEHSWTYISIPVFYLTSRLSAEVDQEIRKEIMTVDKNVDVYMDKVCCYVPWKKEKDGTLDDVWDIIWEMYTCLGSQNRGCGIFACIDEQSGIDKSVLLIEVDYYHGDLNDAATQEILKDIRLPNIKGFSYIRTEGRGLHIAQVNLDLANMGIEDFSIDDQPPGHFRRVGWPSRDVLRDPYSEDEEEDYGHDDE